MNNMHLRSVDLNLLTVFNAIYDYGRLTRAADALGMTQPAVSHALKRLRALFDDALFVRTRARMEPTPRAHAMAGPIAEILQNVRKVLEPGAPFDPASARREIRIGLLDYGITVFAPRIASFVMSAAPALKIDFRHTESGRAVRQIDDGDIDLYIGPLTAPPPAYHRNALMLSDAVVVARRGHPGLSSSLTLTEYCALDHVRFTNLSTIDREIDTILANNNLTRRTVIKVPHYSSALFVASRSDLVTTITRGPAALYRDFLDLDLYETPFQLSSSEISMLRHPRTDNDPLVLWLWEHIRTIEGLGETP
ncbi:MAG: DNA-binding transcriptional LysR family regulator [Paracoccaceae bacterium]|jgi:DNA-binding transcriptional LysR family regulator